MTQHDPRRLTVSLDRAVADGSWNPTDWGRKLLRNLRAAAAVHVEDDEQAAMREAMLGVHASDMIVHVTGEIRDGLMPAVVLASAIVDGPTVVRPDFARTAPEQAPTLRIAA